MSKTQLLTRDAYGVTYADPNDPDFTIRFKTVSKAKSLNGARSTNYVTEIIVNDNTSVTIGGVAAVDAISLRIRTSGARESMPRLVAILKSVANQLGDWADSNALIGFVPPVGKEPDIVS